MEINIADLIILFVVLVFAFGGFRLPSRTSRRKGQPSDDTSGIREVAAR